MATREEKKDELRDKIVQAAEIYSRELSGKVFLYVVGDESFEVCFPSDHFRHLTGVCSRMSAGEFYRKAKNHKLEVNQFYTTDQHPFSTAQQKMKCLHQLPELTRNTVCVVKDMWTASIVYKLGLTNLSFTIGLTRQLDKDNKPINTWYVPQTLRVKDDSIENSQDSDFVDFILMRDASKSKYETVMYSDPNKPLPETVADMLSEELRDRFYGKEETSSC